MSQFDELDDMVLAETENQESDLSCWSDEDELSLFEKKKVEENLKKESYNYSQTNAAAHLYLKQMTRQAFVENLPSPVAPPPSRPAFDDDENQQHYDFVRMKSFSLPDLVAYQESKRRENKDAADSDFHLPIIKPVHPVLKTRRHYQESFHKKNGNSSSQERVYLPFVRLAPTEIRNVSATDKRSRKILFPGWCYGCRLCYGCENAAGPHLHREKPVRTGGGFTYMKKEFSKGHDYLNSDFQTIDKSAPSGRDKFLQWVTRSTDKIIPLPKWALREIEEQIAASNSEAKAAATTHQTVSKPTQFKVVFDEKVSDSLMKNTHAFSKRESHRRGERLYRGGPASNIKSDKILTVEVPSVAMEIYFSSDEELPNIAQPLQDYRDQIYASKSREEVHTNKSQVLTSSLSDWTVQLSTSRQPKTIQQILDNLMQQNESEKKEKERIKHRLPAIQAAQSQHQASEEPIQFKPKLQKKPPTIPKDPFSKNRDFHMEEGQVFKPMSRKRATQFQPIPQRANMADDKMQTKGKIVSKRKIPSIPQFQRRDQEKQSPYDTSSTEENVVESLTESTQNHSTIDESSHDNLESVLVEHLETIEELEEPPLASSPRRSSINREASSPQFYRENSSFALPTLPSHEATMTSRESEMESTFTSTPNKSTEEEMSFIIVDSPTLTPLPEGSNEKIVDKVIQRKEVRWMKVRDLQKKEFRRKVLQLQDHKFRTPSKIAFAPITKEDLHNLADPLDYLTKYCIIHPNRLPVYERVFRRAVANQKNRYVDGNVTMSLSNDEDNETTLISKADLLEGEEDSSIPTAQLSQKQYARESRKLWLENPKIGRPEEDIAGLNFGDQHLKRAKFQLKYYSAQKEIFQAEKKTIQENLTALLASIVREKHSDVLYQSKIKLMKKVDLTNENLRHEMHFMSDEQILKCTPKKLLDTIKELPSAAKLIHRLQRVQYHLKDISKRVATLPRTIDRLTVYSQDTYYQNQIENSKPPEFKRRQSVLYQRLHPDVDLELNVSEVENLLTSINGQLLTKNEYKFIHHVLNLPIHARLNLQLFSIVAALSEKVKQLEPMVRKIINKLDYEALEVKMERCKHLFFLLDEKDFCTPSGTISVESLLVELIAGGLTEEHVRQVIAKFNREKKGYIDFLDFLTYVPLFVEIHNRIVEDPLNESQLW